MTMLTDMTARNPLKSVRECGFNCVEPTQEKYLLRNVITHRQIKGKRREGRKDTLTTRNKKYKIKTIMNKIPNITIRRYPYQQFFFTYIYI